MKQNDKQIPVILIVDDVEVNARLLKKMVEKMGYQGLTATGVKEAVSQMQKELPQLILLDIMMPDMSGYQFCELLKENPDTKDIPVIFVSAASELDDKMKGFQVGAVDFISKPFDYGEVAMRVNTHLKMYQMKQELEDSNRRLSIIVSEQAKKYDEEQKRLLKALAKITETEWEIMKHHTDNGDELIRAAYPDVEDNTFVKVACDVVRSHHENWDGSGYPDGLKGSDIPLSARIVKIVDVYDSILSDRCYRSAYTKEESLAYMKQGSKSRFDPYILEVFLKIEKQLRK